MLLVNDVIEMLDIIFSSANPLLCLQSSRSRLVGLKKLKSEETERPGKLAQAVTTGGAALESQPIHRLT